MSPTLLLLALAPGFQLRLHVDGDGMFRFARGTQAVYSTDAVLLTSSGVLATSEGYPMLPQIRVPSDGVGVQVLMDGTVTVSGKTAGRIVLASFGNAQMIKFGAYLTASSRSTIGYPGEGVFGVIRTSGGPKRAEPAPVVSRPTDTIDTTVEVSLHSEIDKPDILLGDISTITGSKSEKEAIEGLDLGATPMFGAQRGITRAYILARIRNEGIDPSKIEIECPVGAIVLRKGQKVDEQAMVAAAAEGAKTQLGIDYPMRAAHGIPDLWVPTGEIQFNAKDASPSGEGAAVDLEIDVNGVSITHRTVNLVPTAAVPGIHIGDPLKVRLIKNGATVEVSGKARSAARIGASITIETEGGAVFTGVLRSTSLAEVKL